jgi:Flp pilus assembly protein TadD
LLYAAGDWPSAINDLDAYLAAEPDQRDALLLRGLATQYDGRPAEALRFLSRLIDLDPANGSAYCRRALVLRELGREEDAAADLAKGAALLGK